ncbi:hypothetical protein [Streptomyces sp. A5-4]|uniref:hypothetical protein n=1 Tax=Streptomyces sp. A5-4 TaxID=3384771 RepID=UPI003DA903C3
MEGGEDRFNLGGAYLGALDRTIDEHWICLHVKSWSYSPTGTGRVDLTLDISGDGFRTAGARRAHEIWSAGPPAEPNLWAALDSIGRVAWSRATERNLSARRTHNAPPGATFHLDGRHITDVIGFALALGEAMNGPGGDFGISLDPIDYHLGMGRGAQRPFTLLWHDHHIARTCLGRTPLLHERSPSLREILTFFTERGVEVLLA